LGLAGQASEARQFTFNASQGWNGFVFPEDAEGSFNHP